MDHISFIPFPWYIFITLLKTYCHTSSTSILLYYVGELTFKRRKSFKIVDSRINKRWLGQSLQYVPFLLHYIVKTFQFPFIVSREDELTENTLHWRITTFIDQSDMALYFVKHILTNVPISIKGTTQQTYRQTKYKLKISK